MYGQSSYSEPCIRPSQDYRTEKRSGIAECHLQRPDPGSCCLAGVNRSPALVLARAFYTSCPRYLLRRISGLGALFRMLLLPPNISGSCVIRCELANLWIVIGIPLQRLLVMTDTIFHVVPDPLGADVTKSHSARCAIVVGIYTGRLTSLGRGGRYLKDS